MNEQQARQKIVDIAKSYLGAAQGSPGHKALIDAYNAYSPKNRSYKVTYTDAWCATAVSAWGILAGMADIIPPECSCNNMISLFQKHALSRWEERDDYIPQTGDIVMYDWDDAASNFAATDNKGAVEHVGMVVEVNGNTLKIIEGNISKSVGYRTIQVNGRYIRGYCLPAYGKSTGGQAPAPAPTPAPSVVKVGDIVDFTGTAHRVSANTMTAVACKPGKAEITQIVADARYPYHLIAVKGGGSNVYGWVSASDINAVAASPTPDPAPAPAPVPGQKSIDEIAREVIRGDWGNNPTRTEKLRAAGYDAAAVQKRVNEILGGAK